MQVQRTLRIIASLAATVLLLAVGAPASAGRPRPQPDQTPPTAPTTLRVTAVTHTSISVAWDPSTDNVGVISYVVWYDGMNGVQAATAPQTSTTLGGLKPGSTYRINIRAWDAAYNGSTTVSVSAATPADTDGPTTPSALTVLSVTASTVLLSWNAGIDSVGIVTHEILVNGAVTPHALSTTTPGTFPRPTVQSAYVRRLAPGTAHTIVVRARDASGNLSAPSNAVSATTLPSSDTVAPTTPTLLSTRSGGVGYCPEELWLGWTASTDDVETGAGIEYEVRVNGSINEVIPGGTSTITYTEVTGLNSVTISAVDRAGNASAPSNAIDVTTNFPPCG